MILKFSVWVESLVKNAPLDRDGRKDEARFIYTLQKVYITQVLETLLVFSIYWCTETRCVDITI